MDSYEPSYFLLENVQGLLWYPLMATQEGLCMTGGIKMGVVKFVIRTLIALG